MKHTILLLGLVLSLGVWLTLVPPAADAQVRKHVCGDCHNLHGGTLVTTDVDLQENLCLGCHDGVTVPGNLPTVHNGSKHTVKTSCRNCHDHYGEGLGNIRLIPNTVNTPNSGPKTVVFDANRIFADETDPYDGICEVCHTSTSFHKNDGTAPAHDNGPDCMTCHGHPGGFQPTGCTGCHKDPQDNGVPPTRRAIVGEFDYTSHHIDLTAAGYATSQDIPQEDCEVCHDQSNHQGGSVRLKNVDTPSTIYVVGVDRIDDFCLACHSNNLGVGVGGTPPFPDNITPPEVDGTLWNNSSHGNSIDISGGCFDCHDSGHGSMKTKMLAPYNLASTAPANAEQEEGFCFGCHNSGGPGIDMETRYNLPINWVPEGTGINDLDFFNDRHDVQYEAQTSGGVRGIGSGAKIECSDCHDPHSATAAQPWKSNPDPSEDVYLTSGVSDYTLFCLDCHDGTFPAGVQAYPDVCGNQNTAPCPLVNIDMVWAEAVNGGKDRMGMIAGGAVLSGQTGGWSTGVTMECYHCHDPHPVATYPGAFAATNFFGLIAPVYSQDLLEPLEGWSAANTWTITDYSFSTFYTSKQNNQEDDNGSVWCNTCHDRSGMMGKSNCTSCHAHGNGKF